ncbi:MAG TPA: hypothetical protein VLF66_13055 [Thermoanaerobaculia bacterium]|nr:hypothetical protein [Thermoanaerobaculia bacterium]
MAYTRQQGNDFWLEFDNTFLFQTPPEIRQIYTVIQGPDTIRRLWTQHRAAGTYPDGFREAVAPMADALTRLADFQVGVMRRHFEAPSYDLQLAFEDFGQGVLFDDRRNPGDKIHKMDTGGPLNPPIGYHRWHPINRAAVFSGADDGLWLELDRFVGLAWAIQSDVKPIEDDPNNPPLPDARLQQLRDIWLCLDWDELDAAFDSVPFPDPDHLPPPEA